MRWGVAVVLVLLAVLVLFPGKMENKNNTAERMKQIRAIKKRKAQERADSARSQMKKVA